MNKKVFFVFVLSLFLLLPLVLNLINSQAENSTIFGISPDSGVKLTEKWEYLGKEWKNILMGNSIIRGIDSFFQKISIVFSVLFGIEYSLSLALFLTIILWLYVFFMLTGVLGNIISSKWVSLLISLGFVILLAQIKSFQIPVNFLIGLFFGENPWWMKLIIGLIIFAILAVVFILIKNFGKQLAANKKKVKEEKNRLKLQTGARAGEALSKAVSKNPNI